MSALSPLVLDPAFALAFRHALRLYPGGHGIGAAMAADFAQWLDARPRDPA